MRNTTSTSSSSGSGRDSKLAMAATLLCCSCCSKEHPCRRECSASCTVHIRSSAYGCFCDRAVVVTVAGVALVAVVIGKHSIASTAQLSNKKPTRRKLLQLTRLIMNTFRRVPYYDYTYTVISRKPYSMILLAVSDIKNTLTKASRRTLFWFLRPLQSLH